MKQFQKGQIANRRRNIPIQDVIREGQTLQKTQIADIGGQGSPDVVIEIHVQLTECGEFGQLGRNGTVQLVSVCMQSKEGKKEEPLQVSFRVWIRQGKTRARFHPQGTHPSKAC